MTVQQVENFRQDGGGHVSSMTITTEDSTQDANPWSTSKTESPRYSSQNTYKGTNRISEQSSMD